MLPALFKGIICEVVRVNTGTSIPQKWWSCPSLVCHQVYEHVEPGLTSTCMVMATHCAQCDDASDETWLLKHHGNELIPKQT